MGTKPNGQRITLKRIRPNPLFQDWLEELYEEAQQKQSKLETMLKEALSSISKYPLPLKSGAECIILQGFEKKLCTYLDQRLEVYNYNLRHATNNATSSSQSETSSNGIVTESVTNVLNVRPKTSKVSKISDPAENDLIPLSDDVTDNTPPSETDSQTITADTIPECVSPNSSSANKKSKRTNMYKPAHRSGAYAILVTLLEHSLEDSASLTKEEIIETAQKHSEESFTRPKPQTFYTAWSNMTRLVTKGLVKKTKSKKVAFSLTEAGVDLAKELLRDSKTVPTVNDMIFNNEPCAVAGNDNFVCNDLNVIEMAAGTFDVVLLIDKNETGGVSKKNDPTVAQFNKYPDLKHEYRSLKVGDFTWVARHRINKQELVLPYVIERKRMDDLGASIKDGRFHEQKFRLRKCGLKNVIYMVENYGSNKHVGLPLQSLMQALANTRVQDGFKVHITDSLTNSARFLAMMTKRLTIRFKDKTLKGRNDEPRDKEFMSFEYFNKSSSKSKPLTVTETFIKLLLQLKGLTVEKALAITSKYSTPQSLIKAYESCDRKEAQFLLANLKYGDQSRNVGPNISKSVYQLFSTTGAD